MTKAGGGSRPGNVTKLQLRQPDLG